MYGKVQDPLIREL